MTAGRLLLLPPPHCGWLEGGSVNPCQWQSVGLRLLGGGKLRQVDQRGHQDAEQQPEALRCADSATSQHVNLRHPESGEIFDLWLRRGYIFRCRLEPSRFGDRPPLNLAGLHLQSNRGSSFSHYKRMAQARIVRAALQPCVLAVPEEDVIILGDLNSAETDLAIAPLADEAKDGRSAGLRHFTSAVQTSQRTFIVETLRCLDCLTVILVRAHPFVLVVVEEVFIW